MTTGTAHTRPRDDCGRFSLIGQILRGTAAGVARALTAWLLERLHQ
ncbi:hypothetical protein [Streptomyces decoyicus]